MNYLCICWMTVICCYFWASKRVFKWELWRTAQHSCKLFQISFYKFTSYRLCVLYYLTISLLCSICLVSVTHPKKKMNKLKIQSKSFYTPYLNFITNTTHSPFLTFNYLQEIIIHDWRKNYMIHSDTSYVLKKEPYKKLWVSSIMNIFNQMAGVKD